MLLLQVLIVSNLLPSPLSFYFPLLYLVSPPWSCAVAFGRVVALLLLLLLLATIRCDAMRCDVIWCDGDCSLSFCLCFSSLASFSAHEVFSPCLQLSLVVSRRSARSAVCFIYFIMMVSMRLRSSLIIMHFQILLLYLPQLSIVYWLITYLPAFFVFEGETFSSLSIFLIAASIFVFVLLPTK